MDYVTNWGVLSLSHRVIAFKNIFFLNFNCKTLQMKQNKEAKNKIHFD